MWAELELCTPQCTSDEMSVLTLFLLLFLISNFEKIQKGIIMFMWLPPPIQQPAYLPLQNWRSVNKTLNSQRSFVSSVYGYDSECLFLYFSVTDNTPWTGWPGCLTFNLLTAADRHSPTSIRRILKTLGWINRISLSLTIFILLFFCYRLLFKQILDLLTNYGLKT